MSAARSPPAPQHGDDQTARPAATNRDADDEPTPDGQASGQAGAALRRCACGGAWLDHQPGRDAHAVVFGHQPAPRDPKETPPQ
jgi:hypothetical protein